MITTNGIYPWSFVTQIKRGNSTFDRCFKRLILTHPQQNKSNGIFYANYGYIKEFVTKPGN
jgi:hypothetical protein